MDSIKIQELEDQKFRIQFMAPPEMVEKEREGAFEEFSEKEARSLTLKGFRKGKAPKFALRLAIANEYKQYFQRKVAEKLLAEAVEQIQYETKWKMMFRPEVNDIQYDDATFSCDLTFMKKPDVKLGEYKGMEIPKLHIEGTAEARQAEMLQSLRMEKGDNEPFSDTDAVFMGDKITMDVVAKVGEEEIFREDGSLYTVGEGRIHESFDAQLIGMLAGETKTFSLPYGDKEAEWTVKVHMGLKVKAADLDDSLALQYGLKDLAELEQQVAFAVSNQMQQQERNGLKQQILLKVLDGMEVSLPKYLVDMEVEVLCKNQNVDMKALTAEDLKYFTDTAERQVKLALAFDKISEEVPELIFTDMEMIEMLKQHLTAAGRDADATIHQAAASGQLQGLIAGLKNESVVEWLIQNASIVE